MICKKPFQYFSDMASCFGFGGEGLKILFRCRRAIFDQFIEIVDLAIVVNFAMSQDWSKLFDLQSHFRNDCAQVSRLSAIAEELSA